MWYFIINQVIPLVGILLLGTIGWWITNYIAKPILDISLQRLLIREELNFWRDLSKDWSKNSIEKGGETFRRLSAKVESSYALSKYFWGYYRLRGYDLEMAYDSLKGLANVHETNSDERKILIHRVEKALNLPISETEERIRRIIARNK